FLTRFFTESDPAISKHSLTAGLKRLSFFLHLLPAYFNSSQSCIYYLYIDVKEPADLKRINSRLVTRISPHSQTQKMVVAEGHILTFRLADLHRTFAEGVKRYVLLSSPPFDFWPLDPRLARSGGPDRTRTCDPALIKRML